MILLSFNTTENSKFRHIRQKQTIPWHLILGILQIRKGACRTVKILGGNRRKRRRHLVDICRMTDKRLGHKDE